jgi:hydrogenase small subunit
MAFCTTMAAALSLQDAVAAQIARAVAKADKPVLVWLEFQDCAGNTESFLRASRPTAAEVVLDVLSVDYHETIMAAAGAQAGESRPGGEGTRRTIHRGGRGLDPTGANGAYCTIGGRSALDIIAREVCGGAPRRLPSARAPRSAAAGRRAPQSGRWRSPTPSRAPRPSSTCPPARRTSRT